MSISLNKSYYWNVFLPICNNFSLKNCLDRPVFNNVSRLNHSSPINNTEKNKTKHLPELYALGPQIALKQRLHYFLSWSTITTKLYLCVYNHKDDCICKDLLQDICLVTINIWLNFLVEIKPRLVYPFISPCIHFRNLPRYKNDNWFWCVTLHWTKYQRQTKVFCGGRIISRGNNYTSLSLNYNCFLHVGSGRVRIFSYLYLKCWRTRGRLLNS